MVYLRNGQVVAKRSKLHPAALLDFLWNFFNLIGLFIGTMSAKTPKRQRKKERGYHNYLPGGGDGGDGDGGGGGRRRRGPNIHVTQPPPSCGGDGAIGG